MPERKRYFHSDVVPSQYYSGDCDGEGHRKKIYIGNFAENEISTYTTNIYNSPQKNCHGAPILWVYF